MNDLTQALKSIVDSVEKAAKDKDEKITAISKKQEQFWQSTGDPALRVLTAAINHLPGRDSGADSYYRNGPIGSLKVRDKHRDEYEFTFDLKVTRDNLKLFVELGNNKKKYPVGEIRSAEPIYKAFFDQYKKALREKLIPK
ncbi:MAG: hypothetical protein ABSG73_13835 [Candidatus Aminicenantales bacterium]|jgi:hypothetical protein